MLRRRSMRPKLNKSKRERYQQSKLDYIAMGRPTCPNHAFVIGMRGMRFSELWSGSEWNNEMFQGLVDCFSGEEKSVLWNRFRKASVLRTKESRISIPFFRHSNPIVSRYRDMLDLRNALRSLMPKINPDNIIISPKSCFEVSNSYLNSSKCLNIYLDESSNSIVCFMPQNISTPVLVREVNNGYVVYIKDDELDSGYQVTDLLIKGIETVSRNRSSSDVGRFSQIGREDNIKFMREVRNVQASVVST